MNKKMEEIQKISVDIPKEHYDKLKVIAKENYIKLSDVIRTMIRIFLE